MLSLAIIAISAAILIWPTQSGVTRLRVITLLPPSRWPRPKITRPGPVVGIAVLGIAALLVSGLGVAIAVVVAGLTVLRRWRARNELRGRLAATEGMAQALSGMVAELNAGANAAAAAAAVAEDAEPESAAVLVAVAGAVRLGGDVDRAVRYCVAGAPHLAGLLRPLAAALTLARRHGLPTAEVLDAVRKDVDGRVRFSRQVQARMAGPRASGTVLAALPIVGIVLGQLMGAAPLHVLLTSGIGQTLLAVGTALVCAGVLWIATLTSQAALP